MKHTLTLLTALLLAPLAARCAAVAGEATPATRVLANLCSGPPADPLPPLRANRPSAAEMAAKPRQHPYLFFDVESRQALRDRAKIEPFRSWAEKLRAHAEECLKRQIPKATAVEGIPPRLPDGSINPEYLRRARTDEFYHQSYAVKNVIPTLAFAYQVTGNLRYGNAGKKWLLELAARSKFSRKDQEADFVAANTAFGMALGYDWLWELLNDSERQQVQRAMSLVAQPIVDAAKKYLASSSPNLIRGRLGNNHVTRTHGLSAIVPLALLYEMPQAVEWLDIEIQLHRDRLYPSAWAPNGEHIDAWDHFDSSLGDPIPFVVALKRLGGEDLFNDPLLAQRFRGMSRFYCYGLEQPRTSPSFTYAWLALASQLRDPIAQWIVTHGNGLKRLDDIFGYLFYDSTVAPAEPPSETGSIYWPYSGMVKMCTDWSSKGILIPFRCGPQIGKDFGDQNGFRLRAGDEWLLPRLEAPRPAPDQPSVFAYDLIRWFRGSAGQNVLLTEPDKIGDYASYQNTHTLPLKGGIQISQFLPIPEGYQDDHYKQWLGGRDIPKTGDLRVVHFDEALDYVCGEAHRAYVSSPPSLWVRHVLFVKRYKAGLPPYILICDEAEADDQPRTFAWQLHTRLPLSLAGRHAEILGKTVGLDIHLLAPLDNGILEKQTPAVRDDERSRFIQSRTTTPQKRCVWLTALFPKPKGTSNTDSPSFRVMEAQGGWAVEVSTDSATDVAMFRSERAGSVSVADISATGTAALLRKCAKLPATLYLLGNSQKAKTSTAQ